jgi:putative PIN family toxin of toxin-antitoxin system
VRIAIDTNTLIAALAHPRGSSARIVRAWKERRVEAVASEATVREAELVLGGGWLTRLVPKEKIDELLQGLRTDTVWVEDPMPITDLPLKDEGDLRMVEAAVSGDAQYIVTTDREFLSQRGYGGVEFVTTGELLRVMERESS